MRIGPASEIPDSGRSCQLAVVPRQGRRKSADRFQSQFVHPVQGDVSQATDLDGFARAIIHPGRQACARGWQLETPRLDVDTTDGRMSVLQRLLSFAVVSRALGQGQ
jgi:hypothetical protein